MTKLIIVGEGGVGKSSFVSKLKHKNIKENHVPTLGLETSDISYNGFNFTIWDTSGTEKFSGLREGYCIGSACALIMISDTKSSYESLKKFKTMILRNCGNIPIAIVVNKCELNNAEINYNNLLTTEKNVVLISCKENISIYEPLDKLISLLNV